MFLTSFAVFPFLLIFPVFCSTYKNCASHGRKTVPTLLETCEGPHICTPFRLFLLKFNVFRELLIFFNLFEMIVDADFGRILWMIDVIYFYFYVSCSHESFALKWGGCYTIVLFKNSDSCNHIESQAYSWIFNWTTAVRTWNPLKIPIFWRPRRRRSSDAIIQIQDRLTKFLN